MPSLFNRRVMDSYKELLKLTNTGAGLDSTLRTVEDGNGTVAPLSLSSTQIALNGLIWPTVTPGVGQVLSVSTGNQLTWSNANGSSVVPVLTYQGVLGTSSATLATASQDTLLTQITLVNTTSSAITVNLNIVPQSGSASAANAIFSNGSVAAGQTVVISTEMVILNGGSLVGSASATGVTINVSGNGSSNIQRLYFGAMPTSSTVVYTVPTGKTETVNSLIICNSSGSDQTISVNFTNGGAASAANAYLNNVTVSANTTLLCDLSTVLPAGWTVTVIGSSANMSIMVTGF
jgi:hypothetical protein